MTLETCKARLNLAKTPEQKKFWEERIARKVKRFPKYREILEKANQKIEEKEVKQNAKKPER